MNLRYKTARAVFKPIGLKTYAAYHVMRGGVDPMGLSFYEVPVFEGGGTGRHHTADLFASMIRNLHGDDSDYNNLKSKNCTELLSLYLDVVDKIDQAIGESNRMIRYPELNKRGNGTHPRLTPLSEWTGLIDTSLVPVGKQILDLLNQKKCTPCLCDDFVIPPQKWPT